MDPHTLNLDPDPEFWPYLDPKSGPDPDRDPGLCSILKEKFKIILEKNYFL